MHREVVLGARSRRQRASIRRSKQALNQARIQQDDGAVVICGSHTATHALLDALRLARVHRFGASEVDVAAELARVDTYWTPRVVGRVNDQYVKVAKLLGELVWHAHDAEDELFLVMSETLRIQLPDDEVTIGPGQFYVVPRGVRHNPVADEEVHIVLIETVTTAHTGNVVIEGTVPVDQQIGDFH